jgi:hypothetical protein
MLFKIKHDKDIFELNPELRAIPEFDKLEPRQMQVVALVADYNSPLKSLPEKERRTKACELSGYKFESIGRLARDGRAVVYGERHTIEAAIKRYREIQYDERRATLEAIDAQINEAIEIMKMDKSKIVKRTTKKGDNVIEEYYTPIELAEKAMKLGKGLAELKETKEVLLSQLDKTESVTDIITYTSADINPEDVTGEISTLDLVMAKKISDGAAQ